MNTLRLVAALLVPALLLPAAPARAEVQAAAAVAVKPLRVMPLGDSITRGSGGKPIYGYRNGLWNLVAQQASYKIDFVGSMTSDSPLDSGDNEHEGHPGWTVGTLAGSVDGWMATYRPDVVLLHAGINDLNLGASATDVVSRLNGLVNQLIAGRPGVTVVLSGLIPVTTGLEAEVAEVNVGVREIAANEVAEGNKVRYVDMPLTSRQNQMDDDLHPNSAGYAVMAASYFAGLSQVVADGWAHAPYDSFTGDARADLVVHTGAGLAVREAAPAGGFGSDAGVSSGWGQFHGIEFAGGLGRLYPADFDGDGYTDLIEHNGTNVNVWINDRAGGLRPGTNVTSGYGRYHGLHVTNGLGRLHFADYDGDGRDDMIIHDGTDINVRRNLGTGRFGSTVNVSTGYGRFHGLRITNGLGRLYFADFDGDGRDDMIVHSGSDVFVRINNGEGFDADKRVTTGYGRFHGLDITDGLGQLFFADYDGDGRDDMIVHNGTDVFVRINNGAGGFSSDQRVTTGYGRYHGLQISGSLGDIAFA